MTSFGAERVISQTPPGSVRSHICLSPYLKVEIPLLSHFRKYNITADTDRKRGVNESTENHENPAGTPHIMPSLLFRVRIESSEISLGGSRTQQHRSKTPRSPKTDGRTSSVLPLSENHPCDLALTDSSYMNPFKTESFPRHKNDASCLLDYCL